MALNLGSGGDFLPYVKFNSKSDKWFIKGDAGDVETGRPTFVADFKNIKTGWFLLKEATPPSIVYDENLTTPAAKPSDEHRRGFKLPLYSQQFFGGDGLVEFTGTSMHVCAAINDVYVQYEKDAAANPGKLPVVACTNSTPQKDKYGTNYKPVFMILKWVETPPLLSGAAISSAPPSDTATLTTGTAGVGVPETPRVTSSEF